VLASALKALAAHRGQTGALAIDAFKLSHHGSRGNLTSTLLQAVQARHYLISTNSADFCLPDDEALARIVLSGGVKPTLWFNYGTARNQRWADADLKRRNGFEVVQPSETERGVVLTLPLG